jgi:hypothetical protein
VIYRPPRAALRAAAKASFAAHDISLRRGLPRAWHGAIKSTDRPHDS